MNKEKLIQKGVKQTRITVKDIRNEYPYSNETISRTWFRYYQNNDYEITFDAKLAYKLKKRGKDAIIWGGSYQGKNIFVFDGSITEKEDLPFF